MNDAELRKNIATNIRTYRAKQRISQEVLAELSNTTQQYIAKVENEQINISAYKLVKIAEALNTDVNSLIDMQ